MGEITTRRHTRMLRADAAGIAEAAAILRASGLVAFPTETVYGLGAHALDTRAVRRIFEAKERPATDPLIVHVAEPAQVEGVAVSTDRARQLGRRFWPGPLTLVLAKRSCVPGEVTAGLETVAVRVPAHPVARRLLAACGLPLAAPSANLFGRPSPTRAEHVLDDLHGRIDAILDGGPTTLGVESTIVDVSTTPPRLLRPGGVPAEEIEAALGVQMSLGPAEPSGGALPAPGLLPVHYSPRTPLTLIVGPPQAARVRLQSEVEAALADGKRVGVLLLEEDAELIARHAANSTVRQPALALEIVGAWADPTATARRLFDALRSLDAARLDVLFARELADPSIGLGRALADRVRRAARQVLDSRA